MHAVGRAKQDGEPVGVERLAHLSQRAGPLSAASVAGAVHRVHAVAAAGECLSPSGSPIGGPQPVEPLPAATVDQDQGGAVLGADAGALDVHRRLASGADPEPALAGALVIHAGTLPPSGADVHDRDGLQPSRPRAT